MDHNDPGDIETRLRRLEYQLDVLGYRQALAENYLMGGTIALAITIALAFALLRAW